MPWSAGNRSQGSRLSGPGLRKRLMAWANERGTNADYDSIWETGLPLGRQRLCDTRAHQRATTIEKGKLITLVCAVSRYRLAGSWMATVAVCRQWKRHWIATSAVNSGSACRSDTEERFNKGTPSRCFRQSRICPGRSLTHSDP